MPVTSLYLSVAYRSNRSNANYANVTSCIAMWVENEWEMAREPGELADEEVAEMNNIRISYKRRPLWFVLSNIFPDWIVGFRVRVDLYFALPESCRRSRRVFMRRIIEPAGCRCPSGSYGGRYEGRDHRHERRSERGMVSYGMKNGVRNLQCRP